MQSMTAFAAAEKRGPGVSVAAEIRTYNSRGLDLVLRLPPGWAGLEEKIRGLIAARLVRGRVELRLNFRDDTETAGAYTVDLPRAKAYLDAVSRLAQAVNRPESAVSLEFLAAQPGLIAPADPALPVEARWPLIAECLNEALGLIDAMRGREGAFIGRDLALRLDGIEAQLNQIEAAADDLPARYREKLEQRIEALTQGLTAIDPLRLAQEAALLAERSDISEEIVRARSHVEQFRAIMAGPEPAGRKLNFLLQEFNREFNTMGSKVGQAAVAHAIVEVKTELEKMREQIQNIE